MNGMMERMMMEKRNRSIIKIDGITWDVKQKQKKMEGEGGREEDGKEEEEDVEKEEMGLQHRVCHGPSVMSRSIF